MYKYNISKYNPAYRDCNWKYTKEDWTAISDIGKNFEGKVLSVEEYIATEDNYVKVIETLFNFFSLEYLRVNNVQKSFEDTQFMELISKRKVKYSSEILEMYSQIENIKKLEYKDLESFIKLMLREDIGAKIYYPRKLKVFINYDFLMGIESSHPIRDIIPLIEYYGLFVEEF